MTITLYLILISAAVAGAFLIAFIWACKSGQFNDLSTPPLRILFDDSLTKKEHKES